VSRARGTPSRVVSDQLAENPPEHGSLVEAPPEAVGIEPSQELGEAFAFLPEKALRGHPHVVEKYLVVVHLAGQTADRPDVHPRRGIVDDEHAQALRSTCRGSGAGEDETVAADARVAAPDLVAADHVLVAVARGFGLERQEIRARLRLAEPLPERRVAARDARQHLAPQVLRAIADDPLRRLVAAGERAEGRRRRGQLLEEQQLVRQRPLLTAEGARPRQGQPALVGQRPQEWARVGARPVTRVHAVDRECLGRVRAQKTAYLFGECPLGRTELEVHEGGRQHSASIQ
jgi:hypothetical protein